MVFASRDDSGSGLFTVVSMIAGEGLIDLTINPEVDGAISFEVKS